MCVVHTDPNSEKVVTAISIQWLSERFKLVCDKIVEDSDDGLSGHDPY
jgi:hypothetical protein